MRFYNLPVLHNTPAAVHYFANVPKLDVLP